MLKNQEKALDKKKRKMLKKIGLMMRAN